MSQASEQTAVEMSEESPRHTPGPWEIELRDDVGERGHSMHIVTSAESTLGWGICRVHNHCGARALPDNAESEANARLISAAPDLLDAAQFALEQIQFVFKRVQLTPGLDDALCTAKDELRDAINKALGKA